MHEKIDRDYRNNNDFVELFERRLSEYTGSPYVVAVDRCTNALILCMEYFKYKDQSLNIPSHTYLSVPMSLINYGYKINFRHEEWKGHYRIGDTNVYDYAVGFEKNMYVSGQIQCLSFQQKKRLSIGKGGAILLDNFDMYEKLKRMRHDGRNSAIPTALDNNIIMGYHMYMSPDEASKGILLLNQLSENYSNGSWKDYPNISEFECFRGVV
jgi:dTDP-4-amino-4,6-dideoxygalactose transaminase